MTGSEGRKQPVEVGEMETESEAAGVTVLEVPRSRPGEALDGACQTLLNTACGQTYFLHGDPASTCKE